MALNIQNDLGTVVNANSYVSVQEFKDYWTARNVDYNTKSDLEIEAYLIKACSYLDVRFKYSGYKVNGRAQTTEFPRTYLYDCSGEVPELVEGVPREIKEAQNEYAHIQAEQGFLQTSGSTGGPVKKLKESVGPIETETEYFSPGQNGSFVNYPSADNKIPSCFLASSSNVGLSIHV